MQMRLKRNRETHLDTEFKQANKLGILQPKVRQKTACTEPKKYPRQHIIYFQLKYSLTLSRLRAQVRDESHTASICKQAKNIKVICTWRLRLYYSFRTIISRVARVRSRAKCVFAVADARLFAGTLRNFSPLRKSAGETPAVAQS